MSTVFYRARFAREHRWAPAHMSGYLDGELASRGRVRLERHVGECEECRRVLAGLREMLAQLGGLPSPPARRDRRGIAASVRQRLHDG